MSQKVLITGSSGFVGKHLCDLLVNNKPLILKKYQRGTDVDQAVDDVDIVIHCAARNHIMKEESSDPLSEYRKANVEGTINLAKAAAKSGVKRFIFLSSVKVNGEMTLPNQPFSSNSTPAPSDPYGISKLEAELALLDLSQEIGMEVVIIRPPLVYGSGVKGNFSSLLKLAFKNLPLPLGAINNKRSMVSIENLCSLIVTCLDHKNAPGKIFFVSDDNDISTSELLATMTKAYGKKPCLLPIPQGWIYFAAGLIGKKAIADRLCGSLQVDISETKRILGWKPHATLESTLEKMNLKSSTSNDKMILRFLDIIFSFFGLLCFFPLLVLLYILGLFDTGSPLFWQQRVGKNKRPFTLVKFRTMKVDTASVASHLASKTSITAFGSFLRKSKLDELPQLWNVLKGEMSLVGPRPCLFNQVELIEEREKRGVLNVRPGITGLAQVNKIDMSTPELLAKTDAKMIGSLNLYQYFRYILLTVMGKGSGDRVR